MKIYNFNKKTRELINESEATENPLLKGEFLIPANATTISPLVPKINFAVVLNEKLGEWEYVKDFRNIVVFSKENNFERIVDYLGEISENFTESKPEKYEKWDKLLGKWVIDNSARKETLQRELMTLCDTKQDDIKTLFLGYKNTKNQQERYYNKYRRSLIVRANLNDNITPIEENQNIVNTYDIIISKHEQVEKQIEKFTDLIEYFRAKIDDMLKLGELDKSENLMKLAKNFDSSTTADDISSLFLNGIVK